MADTRTIRLTIDEPTLEAVAAALRGAAGQRQRAASRAAVELDLAETKDKRPGAMNIAKVLAEAGRLDDVARRLEAEWAEAPAAEEPAVHTITVAGPASAADTLTPSAIAADLAAAGIRSSLDEDLETEPTPIPEED